MAEANRVTEMFPRAGRVKKIAFWSFPFLAGICLAVYLIYPGPGDLFAKIPEECDPFHNPGLIAKVHGIRVMAAKDCFRKVAISSANLKKFMLSQNYSSVKFKYQFENGFKPGLYERMYHCSHPDKLKLMRLGFNRAELWNYTSTYQIQRESKAAKKILHMFGVPLSSVHINAADVILKDKNNFDLEDLRTALIKALDGVPSGLDFVKQKQILKLQYRIAAFAKIYPGFITFLKLNELPKFDKSTQPGKHEGARIAGIVPAKFDSSGGLGIYYAFDFNAAVQHMTTTDSCAILEIPNVSFINLSDKKTKAILVKARIISAGVQTGDQDIILRPSKKNMFYAPLVAEEALHELGYSMVITTTTNAGDPPYVVGKGAFDLSKLNFHQVTMSQDYLQDCGGTLAVLSSGFFSGRSNAFLARYLVSSQTNTKRLFTNWKNCITGSGSKGRQTFCEYLLKTRFITDGVLKQTGVKGYLYKKEAKKFIQILNECQCKINYVKRLGKEIDSYSCL